MGLPGSAVIPVTARHTCPAPEGPRRGPLAASWAIGRRVGRVLPPPRRPACVAGFPTGHTALFPTHGPVWARTRTCACVLFLPFVSLVGRMTTTTLVIQGVRLLQHGCRNVYLRCLYGSTHLQNLR